MVPATSCLQTPRVTTNLGLCFEVTGFVNVSRRHFQGGQVPGQTAPGGHPAQSLCCGLPTGRALAYVLSPVTQTFYSAPSKLGSVDSPPV